ncbi:Orn/Lys/Arg decarboxylase, C-terminal [Artemisia annua]|uniref:Orn/Lys/Arg decarboxylase, C-terminal n=1 Tax=Artemisia annua TaxID=35608 RepID=A0A2U1M0F0_ARTAN|nr:Orn/Lys/Arg decarboxylase, C-terminal [Artemisia annua]
MAFAFLNLGLKCCSTSSASSSEEKNAVKKLEKIKHLSNKNTVMVDKNIYDSQDSEHRTHTPLVSGLKAVADQNVASFQFPGHNRGGAAPSSLSNLIGIQPFLHDLSTPELDNLFAPTGPILDAQKQAAKLFGATETWFLVGGTTCGIQAAIMATCSPGDTLILPRNAHISTFSSMVLSGAIPKYITPEYDFDWDLAGGITPLQASDILFQKRPEKMRVEKAIKELDNQGRKPSAVLVTSPTYHGICSNIEDISILCHSHNIPLIVDEAHGAHLGFHKNIPRSALSQGTDLSIQSTHKVLCSLTQSSMLHMSGNLIKKERICQCLQTLQSTSPSYLLLASLDAARAQISENPQTIFSKAVELAFEAKALIEKIPGFTVLNSDDPLRVTVGLWKLGISGFEANHILYKDGVVAELPDTRSLMFAINLGTSRDDIKRLVLGLEHLSQMHSLIQENEEELNDIQAFMETISGMRLSPREAFFASKMKVSFKESIGRICGELVCPYPPGIPLLIPGEVITKEALSYLEGMKNKGGFVIGVADPSLSSIVVCS